jgi:two-component system, NarL family, sensor histidine kinase UhpB
VGDASGVMLLSGMPLYWRVCLINGLVFVLGTTVLALSPATVSARVLVSEAVVLTVGLAIMLVLNALLLRRSLAPLDRLIHRMESVDLQHPDERLDESGQWPVGQLLRTFNAMLGRLETERSSSIGKALAAQEAERHRIARELHDEIGQSLTVVLLGLKRLHDRAPAALTDEIDAVLEQTRSSLAEVGKVARRLRPGVLDELGLRSALAALATDFAAHGGHVRRGIAPGLPDLEPQQELVIYRVAQEAMTNAARHAQASTVEISLSRQGDAVMLRVADDGYGMRGAAAGAGIHGMRERAKLVDGRLTIGARPDGGTEVRLLVPVHG